MTRSLAASGQLKQTNVVGHQYASYRALMTSLGAACGESERGWGCAKKDFCITSLNK